MVQGLGWFPICPLEEPGTNPQYGSNHIGVVCGAQEAGFIQLGSNSYCRLTAMELANKSGQRMWVLARSEQGMWVLARPLARSLARF